MSVMSTCLVAMYVDGSGDYDYDTINAYRSQLTDYPPGALSTVYCLLSSVFCTHKVMNIMEGSKWLKAITEHYKKQSNSFFMTQFSV